MDNEFLAKTLKRIFDESQEAQNRGDAEVVGVTLVDEFNNLLELYQSQYKQNEVIQNIDPISVDGWGVERVHPKFVQKIKQNCLKIADILELDTSDFREPSTSESFTTIHFEANQQVEQSVSVENIIEMINHQMMPDDDKEDLKAVVNEFTEEIEKKNPDKSKLEQLLNTAREYQPQIALQLGAVGLDHGVDVLLGSL